ncbi:UbiA prenyltransferase family protein [Candidatus Parcubacteria bacterium]|nr:UbiA prenyltransferase family protein [Candidatus Parcubacteria bacterium]
MKTLNYFKMLRIKDTVKFFFWIPLIGAILTNVSLSNFILIAIISFCTVSYAFVINNYFDVEIDKKNPKKIKSKSNPLAQGLVTKKGVLTLSGILLLISISLSLFMNFIGFIFVLLSIFGATFYSMSYIRLKERNIIDMISHGFALGLFLFLAGVFLSQGMINISLLAIAFLFTILSANVLLAHQIMDYEEDLGNTQTTAIKIGKERSYLFLFIFLIAALLLFEIIILKYYSDAQWWFFYSALLLLIFWWLPLKLIRQFGKEKIKDALIEGLLLPNLIYDNKIKVYHKKIKKIFFE